jgi:ABC-type bacteriocin/lantibiotic exporter with double-glycine peptidase domain
VPDYWLALPHHEQEREYTCTPACVRMVLAFFDRHVQEDELALLFASHWLRGTDFNHITRVDALGFHATIRPGIYDDLQAVAIRRVPVLVGIDTSELANYAHGPGAHSVVVVGATDTEVSFHDPLDSAGPRHHLAAGFEVAWRKRGYRLAILRPR